MPDMDEVAVLARSLLDQHWAHLRDHEADLWRVLGYGINGPDDVLLVRRCLLTVVGELAHKEMTDG